MRSSITALALCFLCASSLAQPAPRVLTSHTTENLRGVSAVSQTVAWASGTHGTYLRTSDGEHWTTAQVPGAESLDFRGAVAFSGEEAFLMSAGPGDQSRIYHTTDAGQHWQLQFSNTNPKGFFDSIAFWDAKHGIVLGDPVLDDSGKLKFELLATDDGENWKPLVPTNLPVAEEKEGAFAASNTCLAMNGDNLWFATGGSVARVFHSSDRGRTWDVANTPIVHGTDSTGIFSIAFRDAVHGEIAGGDYKHPNDDGPNLAFTSDGGKTWSLAQIRPQAYFSAVAYDRAVNAEAIRQASEAVGEESVKSRILKPKPAPPERLFIVGQDFVFDFRPPHNPRRIGAPRHSQQKFNAVSALPNGGALVVGANGTIAMIP